MSTAAAPAVISPAPAAPMTAEEFYDWGLLPENAGRRCELDAGRVVDMPPPAQPHGTYAMWIGHLFLQYVAARKRGRVVGDAGLIVATDVVRGPVVAVFAAPKQLAPGYTDAVPDLIVEVVSPNDRPRALNRRVTQYLARGVPVVWLVYPDERSVDVYRPGREMETVAGTDPVPADSLPGFACTAADVFALPDDGDDGEEGTA